jgi:hypothetical protein
MEEADGGHTPASVQQGTNVEEPASQSGSSAMASCGAAASGQKRPRDGNLDVERWKSLTKPSPKPDGTEHASYRNCLDCNKTIQQGCALSAPTLYIFISEIH